MATSSNPEDKSPHHHDGPEPDPFDLPESKKPKGPDYDLIAGVGKLVCYLPERDGEKTLRDVVRWEGMWVPPNEELLKEYVDCHPPEYREILTDYYHMLQKTLGFEVRTYPIDASERPPFQVIELVPDDPNPEEKEKVTRKMWMSHRAAVQFLENLTGNKYESQREDIVSANFYIYFSYVFFITFKATNMSSTGVPRPETFQAAVFFMIINYDYDFSCDNPNDYELDVLFIRLKPETSFWLLIPSSYPFLI